MTAVLRLIYLSLTAVAGALALAAVVYSLMWLTMAVYCLWQVVKL